MFLFDWSKIYREAQGDKIEVQRILRMLVNNQIPNNTYDPIYKYSQKNFSGSSFLLNPRALVEQSRKYTYKEVADYLASASFRSYANYLVTKDATLDRIFLPFAEEKIDSFIKNNRLLQMKDSKIYFLYEEVS